MEPATSPRAVNARARGAKLAPADVESVTTPGEDRLEGAEAIGDFLFPGLPTLEVRRRLERGGYPYCREGRKLVASKSALLKHWREKTAQFKPGQSGPKNKGARRGYRPA